MRRGIRTSTVTLKHLNAVRRGDRVWWYVRVPGQKQVRLPDLPTDHPDFLAAYSAALAGRESGAPGTIADLIDTYLRSRERGSYRPAYRQIVDRHLAAIRDKAGAAMLRHLRADHIRKDMAVLDPHPANQRLKVWRILCAFALARGMATTDVAKDVPRRAIEKSDGHLPWSLKDIAAFRAHWPIGTAQRAAMELVFWTGCRIGDATRLGPGMVDNGGVLTFRQSKTGDDAFVPWTCTLPDWAEDMAADRALCHAALDALSERHMTWIVTTFGSARSVKSIGMWISQAASAAGVDRSAHGLRKSRAIALAEAGATTHQIAAWTGHATLKEVERYTKKADRRRAVMGQEREQNTPNSSVISSNSAK